MKLHFPHPHPTFGTKNNPKSPTAWKVSVYYWWFEYLRRNDDYRRTCENGGKGKCAGIYKDFGDIFNTDFKTWWITGDRGAKLFAEPPAPTMRLIRDNIAPSTDSDNALVIEVPLALPSSFLIKRFREILKKYHSGRRGIQVSRNSNAHRRVASKRIDVNFLDVALRVWDARQAEPKKPLWQIAIEQKIGLHLAVTENGLSTIASGDKIILAATASRYLKKADTIIEYVGKGVFPKSANRLSKKVAD